MHLINEADVTDTDMTQAAQGCVCFTLRQSARTAAKLYDEALKPCGLRNTQFSLLAALDHLGEATLGRLAGEMTMDRTTLTRNLQVMVRDGFVENVTADDARKRVIRLTDAGKEKFAEALPHWRGVQNQVLSRLGPARWQRLAEDLAAVQGIAAAG